MKGPLKTPSNVITTELLSEKGFSEDYDKNFLIAKPNKKEKYLCNPRSPEVLLASSEASGFLGNNSLIKGRSPNTHITVKPVALMEHLIKLFSKEGSVVLDPFMGSGSTGLACIKHNRRFIGVERNKEYYEISCQRLWNEIKKTKACFHRGEV